MNEATSDRGAALKALGLTETATMQEIRSAWRKLAFELHPDRNNGESDGLAEVNAAYEFLQKDDPSKPQPYVRRPARPARGHNPRPAINTRIVDMSSDAEDACKSLLDHEDENPAPDAKEIAASHVPASIRRKGRRLSYIVRTPLEIGSNRVALPTGQFEDARKTKPKVMTFSSDHRGPGRIVVPETLRDTMFPGARSVSIHFEGRADAEEQAESEEPIVAEDSAAI